MTPLRISPPTAQAFDALKANMDRLGRALGRGATTTDAMAQADALLAEMATQVKALRLPVRQEIAGAQRRLRDDQAQRRTA